MCSSRAVVAVHHCLVKAEAGQVDDDYAYGQSSLAHYGRWMAAHEKSEWQGMEYMEERDQLWQELEEARKSVATAQDWERVAVKERDELRAAWDWTDAQMRQLRAENERLQAALGDVYGTGHIAEFTLSGYGLTHPYECRKDGPQGLLDCPVDAAVRVAPSVLVPTLGRFYVSVGEDGQLVVGTQP